LILFIKTDSPENRDETPDRPETASGRHSAAVPPHSYPQHRIRASKTKQIERLGAGIEHQTQQASPNAQFSANRRNFHQLMLPR
jgi:hypothetical protein